MATVNPRDITLSQMSVFGTKKPELTAVLVGERKARDPETKQPTSEVEGYLVNVRAPRTGEVQSVKLPLDAAPQIAQIREALSENKIVTITFKGTFRGKFWAMPAGNDRVNQGISATAQAVEIVDISAPEDEILDDEVDFV